MRKIKLSKMWYVRLVGAWSMFNFAQQIYILPGRYIVESSVVNSAAEHSQIANELILKALCELSYMFFVFAVWLIFEIAVPFYKIRRRLDGGRTIEEDKDVPVNREV